MPVWVRGVVVPSGGAVVAAGRGRRARRGGGFRAGRRRRPRRRRRRAADPEIAAVRTARRMPLVWSSTGRPAPQRMGWVPGASGWKVGSMRNSLSRMGRPVWTNLTRSVPTARERHVRTPTATGATRAGHLRRGAGSRPRRSRRGSGSGRARSGGVGRARPRSASAPRTP